MLFFLCALAGFAYSIQLFETYLSLCLFIFYRADTSLSATDILQRRSSYICDALYHDSLDSSSIKKKTRHAMLRAYLPAYLSPHATNRNDIVMRDIYCRRVLDSFLAGSAIRKKIPQISSLTHVGLNQLIRTGAFEVSSVLSDDGLRSNSCQH